MSDEGGFVMPGEVSDAMQRWLEQEPPRVLWGQVIWLPVLDGVIRTRQWMAAHEGMRPRYGDLAEDLQGGGT